MTLPTISAATGVKLGLALVAALALVLLVRDRNHWKSEAQTYNLEAATVYEATKAASGNLKLARRDTAGQIAALGQGLLNLKQSVAVQNAKIEQLGRASQLQQARADQARQESAKWTAQAQSTAAALVASSGSADRQSAPCEPSAALKGAWK